MNDKKTQYTKAFLRRQWAWNDTFFPAYCLLFGGIEGMLLTVSLLRPVSGVATLDGSYRGFYLAAVSGVAVICALDRLLRRREIPRRLVRLLALSGCLLWSALFARVELGEGHAAYAYTQVLMFLTAGFRLPTKLHCALNTAAYAVCTLAIWRAAPGTGRFACEIINNAIFLIISYAIIVSSNRVQYTAHRAEEVRDRAQRAQLDIMADQVEQAQRTAQKVLEIRHDMRHCAWEVRQCLERGDLAAIGEVTSRFEERLDRTQARPGVRRFTGEGPCDAILSRFAARASAAGVSFQVEMEAPRGMDLQDLCLVLMNALENAAHAAEAQPEGEVRQIQVLSGSARGQYFLEITNTYAPGSVSFREGGLPVSLNPGPDHGYGARSIVSTLEQYGALYRFRAENGVFRFQFLLPEEGGGN